MKLTPFVLGLALVELVAAAPQTHSIGGQASAGAPLPATCVTVFHGPPGGPGAVRCYDDLTGAPLPGPAVLRNARLLPIEFVGRTELTTFDPALPRRRDDVPGAARLVLPDARGSLYRYARGTPAGDMFGFLWIDARGQPVVLAERPGVGASGTTDPYRRRIGVAPDGGAFLVATRASAGGDLLEVRLTSRTVVDRTPLAPPLHFADAGLWLADGWGFGVADEGVFRFDRALDAVAAPLDYGAEPAPTWFAGEAVTSRSRAFAAATAGGGPLEQHVWVFGASGPATRASRFAAELSGAGFLPEAQDGPFLAVSDDGALAAWRSEGLTREVFLARTTVFATPEHVSADANFHDTFDEVGQVLFFQPDELSFGVGGRDEPLLGGLEKMDVYAARFDANGVLQIENRSLTSGDTSPPFDGIPQITPEQAHALPAGVFLHDDDGEELLALRHGQLGVTTLLAEVKEVAWVERVGAHLVVSLRRSFGSKPWQLVRVSSDLTGPVTVIDPGGPEVEFLSPAPSGDGWLGYLSRDLGTQDFARRLQAATGIVETWNTSATTLSPPFGHSPLGHLCFTHGPGAGPSTTQLWPYAGATFPLQAPAGPGFALPSR